MIPERIKQFRILSQVGEGGMGVVYCAEDEESDRLVAIKLISASFVKDPMAHQRFAREVQIASGLHHTNICAVLEHGAFDGSPYMVMELLEGQTLRDRISGRPLPLHLIATLGMDIAAALDAAHERGVVHRDINASNIFVTRSGTAKILDFGLAKISDAPSMARTEPALLASLMSAPGRRLGTASSMSPEQVTGQDVDRRSDIFSFGIVLYQMATGILPFLGASPPQVMRAILYLRHTDASDVNPHIPVELDRIIQRAIEKDRALRYSTAREVLADLARLQVLSQQGQASPSPASLAGPRELRVTAPCDGACSLRED
jgi:eukaryotic-like serine/threonine-protein kinase